MLRGGVDRDAYVAASKVLTGRTHWAEAVIGDVERCVPREWINKIRGISGGFADGRRQPPGCGRSSYN
jgi:formylmethanofuran dehydrogenase subunit A